MHLRMWFGGGYPKRFADEEKISRVKMYTDIKYCSQKDVVDVLMSLNQDDLKELLDYTEFKNLFKQYAKKGEITNYISDLLSA